VYYKSLLFPHLTDLTPNAKKRMNTPRSCIATGQNAANLIPLKQLKAQVFALVSEFDQNAIF